MNFRSIFAFSIFFFSAYYSTYTDAATTAPPIKIEIFYETLNDAARQFFVYQFTPQFFAEHHDKLTLAIIPYGNTTANQDRYVCPFGNQQCQANKMHACFLKTEVDPNPSAIIEDRVASNVVAFLHCFFKNRRAEKNLDTLGEQCMPSGHEPDWPTIRTCLFEDESIMDRFASLTELIGDDIKDDGLAVRIGSGNITDNNKVNFTKEICTRLGSKQPSCLHAGTPLKRVKLAVYYEAMNADSAAYIVNQLASNYHILEDFAEVDLVPYGSTVHDAKADTYKCSLGEAQCISNKYQALVIDAYINKPKNGEPINGPHRAVTFVSCMFQSTIGNIFGALEKCSNSMLKGNDYKQFIEQLKQGSKSATLKKVFADMAAKTTKVAAKGLTRIPTVTINGKIDYGATDDLLGTVCSQLPAYAKPKACTKTNVTVLYEPLDHRTRTFFLETLKPVFRHLHGLINLQLLPGGRTINVQGSELMCPGADRTHRQNHCDAMKWQACVLDHFWQYGDNYTDPVRREIFDFIVCMLKNKEMKSVPTLVDSCSKEYIDDKAWALIKNNCFSKPAGEAVLRGYLDETKALLANVEHRDFPIVIVDGAELADHKTMRTHICDLIDATSKPEYCLSAATAYEKIKVEVYYDAFDEHSRRFLTTQYAPWYPYFEEMATVHLVPGGNIKDPEHTDGTCVSLNKTSACMANKLQSVIIEKYSKINDVGDSIDGSLRLTLFIDCLSSNGNFSKDWYTIGEDCLGQWLPDEKWFDLQIHLSSPAGNEVFKAAIEATKAIRGETDLKVMPWVTLDGAKHSQRATGDLMQTVCQKFTDEKPVECTTTTLEVFYSALDAPFSKFFKGQLLPMFNKLRERVNLQLIPFGVPHAQQTLEQECAGKQEETCLHNRIHACALNRFFKDEMIDDAPILWDGKTQTLTLIGCMLDGYAKDKNSSHLMETCGKTAGIADLTPLTTCVGGTEGQKLLGESRTKTLATFEAVGKSPWVAINGIHSPTAEADLGKNLCSNMIGDVHSSCYHPEVRFSTTKKPATQKPTTKKVTATTKKPAATTKKPDSKPATPAPSKQNTVSNYTLVDILIIVAVGILGIFIGTLVTVLIAYQCAKVKARKEAMKNT